MGLGNIYDTLLRCIYSVYISGCTNQNVSVVFPPSFCGCRRGMNGNNVSSVVVMW